MRYFKTILLAVAAMAAASCNTPDNPGDDGREVSARLIERANIPAVINLAKGKPCPIGGKGYEKTDILRFSAGEEVIETGFISVSASNATFLIDERLSEGVPYEVRVVRDMQYQIIGTTTFYFSNAPITLTGKVTSGGQGLANVWVCDGKAWTRTGADGSYSLKSALEYGYVYVQTPSGYAPRTDGAWPLFWKNVSSESTTADFELDKVNDSEHVMLVSADWQLRNERNPTDLEQASPYFTEVEEIARTEKVPVFAVTCGDETWDVCWANKGFDPAAFKKWAKRLAVPFYVIMGNHDHDMNMADDFSAENTFRKEFGPTCFSFDRGSIHYIFMDNVDYQPADRSVIERFTDAQLSWLRDDLSHVDVTTPVMIFVHVPFHSWTWNGTKWVASVRGKNYSSALSLLEGFPEVHIFSGHSHYNEMFDCKAEGLSSNAMYEHKVVALGGTIWVSGTTIGYNVSRDGVPGGHEIVRVKGKKITWRYKGTGKDPDYQMRASDISSVKQWWKSSVEAAAMMAQYPDMTFENLYGSLPEDAVLINVFRGDPSMKCIKVEASDDKGPLTVNPLYIKDPLSVVALDCWWWYRMRSGLAASYQSAFTQHIFQVVPSSTSKNLKVRLTWPDGGSLEKTYTLPIEFRVDND